MGDADADLGDSIYEAKIFVKGKVKSLGADCVEKKMDKKNIDELTKLFKKLGIKEDAKNSLKDMVLLEIYIILKSIMWVHIK